MSQELMHVQMEFSIADIKQDIRLDEEKMYLFPVEKLMMVFQIVVTAAMKI